RLPTRILTPVYRGFVFKKKRLPWAVQIPPSVIKSPNEHAVSRQLGVSECPGSATVPVAVRRVSRRTSGQRCVWRDAKHRARDARAPIHALLGVHPSFVEIDGQESGGGPPHSKTL